MAVKKKMLIITGGGDCPGLNCVIRAVVKSAHMKGGWEVWGSRRAFNGVLEDPPDVILLTPDMVSGIHVRGGTILKTVNKGGPFEYPVQHSDGSVTYDDVSDRLIQRIRDMGFDAVVSVGGNGSQTISLKLFEKGLPIVGVPKTIDNDLMATDFTFGFQTAVQIATEAIDKLVSTAESHNRVMIAEVMGRDAGWIALHAGIAAGADVILIPELPYQVGSLVRKIGSRIQDGEGFAIVVVAEGARPRDGKAVTQDQGSRYGGIGYYVADQLASHIKAEIRVTVLGHIQRGGLPIAFDRVLATEMGVKAFELADSAQFGKMVSYARNTLVTIPIADAVRELKRIAPDNYLIKTARYLGVSLGD